MLKGDPPQRFAEGEALEIVAKKIGISCTTIRQALWLIEHAPKEELDKLRSGEKSISGLYRELKNSVEKKETGSIPRFLARLLKRASRKGNNKLKINRYAKSEFATIMIDRSLIGEFEEDCSIIKAQLDQSIELEYIIIDALEEYRQRFKRAVKSIRQSSTG